MIVTGPIRVHAIDPARLETIRASNHDGYGNRLRPVHASGQGEPLRCCLRYADESELISLISYAPFERPSVWTEVGPVYVHATRCDGYHDIAQLPQQLRTGPVVLRTYRADHSMHYDHNTLVTTDDDLSPMIGRLLDETDIATIHVRSLTAQCFLYAVTRG